MRTLLLIAILFVAAPCFGQRVFPPADTVPRPAPVDPDKVPDYVPLPYQSLAVDLHDGQPVQNGQFLSIEVDGHEWQNPNQPWATFPNPPVNTLPKTVSIFVDGSTLVMEMTITNNTANAVGGERVFAGPILNSPYRPVFYPPEITTRNNPDAVTFIAMQYNDSPLTGTALYFTCKNETLGQFSDVAVQGQNGTLPVFYLDPLPAGETHTYRAEWDWVAGSLSTHGVVQDVIDDYALLNPNIQDWSDRRPIGTSFPNQYADSSPENPRGWIQAVFPPPHDINTAAGRDFFMTSLLAHADACIATCLDMDAQGCICWCIEGQENPHPISYIGDPTQAVDLAPEIRPVVHKFFQKFVQAGLRPGVTIRPQQYSNGTQTDVGELTYAELYAKIDHAHTKWGCTIFYVDSNVQSNGKVYPSAIYRQLAADFPDCLILPEQTRAGYAGVTSAWTANYTPPNILYRAIDKTSFQCVFGQAESPHSDPASYQRLVEAVSDGQIPMFHAWWANPNNDEIKQAWDDHGWHDIAEDD